MLPWQPMQALSGVLLGSSFSLTYFCPDVIPSLITRAGLPEVEEQAAMTPRATPSLLALAP